MDSMISAGSEVRRMPRGGSIVPGAFVPRERSFQCGPLRVRALTDGPLCPDAASCGSHKVVRAC